MPASFRSRNLACLITLAALLVPAAASAQTPPAPPAGYAPPTGSAPPGYAPPTGSAPPGYAPPGYGPSGYPPPQGYAPPAGYGAPPGYAPYAAVPPQGYGQAYAPFVPMKRQSSVMMGIGITLLAAGGSGLIMGTSMFSAGGKTTYDYPPCSPDGFTCPDPVISTNTGLRNAGIAALVLGTASIAVGIPLVVIGGKRVPDNDPPTALLPVVRVGAGGGGMTWQF
jgi:hypothetical protein